MTEPTPQNAPTLDQAADWRREALATWSRSNATVALPVGAGRVRFVVEALLHARGRQPGLRMVVLAADERVASRWSTDLGKVLDAGDNVLVDPSPARLAGPWTACVLSSSEGWSWDEFSDDELLVVLDEPQTLGHHQVPDRFGWRLELAGWADPAARGRVQLPHQTRQVLEALAVLVADSPPGGRHAWAQLHLRAEEVSMTAVVVDPLSFRVLARRVGQRIRDLRPLTAGVNPERGVGWRQVTWPHGAEAIPSSAVALFRAGDLGPVDVVVAVVPMPGGGGGIEVLYRPAERAQAEAIHRQLQDEALHDHNPYRGAILEVVRTDGGLLDFVPGDTPEDSRSELILPPALWAEVDLNVHALFEQRDLLSRLGLGLNRGLLLVGPPGTGKSRMCRVITAELQQRATVLLPTPGAMADGLKEIYRQAELLAPSLVVLEDLDLVAGHRSSGRRWALHELLMALDGLMTGHNGVVTVATTNDVAAIDPAARRAARFDRVIEVPPPGELARQRILATYLAPLERTDLDLAVVARAATEATGADLRELVRHAVLRHGGSFSTSDLLALVRDGRGNEGGGQYL